ncbi:uncharacterized protein LOC142171556 isoform X2 [Nicotiana tabacum]
MLGPHLVFDCASILGDGKKHKRFTLSNFEDFENERREFVRRVDELMQQMQERIISSLTVSFFLDNRYSFRINGWLKVALASGLTKLELLLYHEQHFLTNFGVLEHSRYYFPYWLLSENSTSSVLLSHLHLEECVIRAPGDFKGFRNLTTLILKHVILGDSFVSEVLPSCLLLERLSLIWCKVTSTLCFEHPSLRIMHLKVLHCFGGAAIRISSMNLTTFEYDDLTINIAHLYAPQLKEIFLMDLGRPFPLARLSGLLNLEILRLHMSLEMDLYQIQKMPRNNTCFTSLKQLDLFVSCSDDDFDLLWLLSFLKTSPLLQKLVLTLTFGKFNENQKEIRKVDAIHHHNELKVLEMHGCVGNWYEIEFQLLILSIAKGLERLIISNSTSIYAGDEQWVDLPREEEDCNQEMVQKQLQGHVPQGVELVFL